MSLQPFAYREPCISHSFSFQKGDLQSLTGLENEMGQCSGVTFLKSNLLRQRVPVESGAGLPARGRKLRTENGADKRDVTTKAAPIYSSSVSLSSGWEFYRSFYKQSKEVTPFLYSHESRQRKRTRKAGVSPPAGMELLSGLVGLRSLFCFCVTRKLLINSTAPTLGLFLPLSLFSKLT